MIDPSTRMVAAMSAMNGGNSQGMVGVDLLAPILECDSDDAAHHAHMLAHACIEDSLEQGDLSTCGAVAHGVIHGILIGYHLGRADAVREQVGG